MCPPISAQMMLLSSCYGPQEPSFTRKPWRGKWKVTLWWLLWDAGWLPASVASCLIWREAKRMQRAHIAGVKKATPGVIRVRPAPLVHFQPIGPLPFLRTGDTIAQWRGERVVSHHYDARCNRVVLVLEGDKQIKVSAEYLDGL